MKFGLMLALLLTSQITFAQTLKEKKVKEEMLLRADSLITKIDEARASLDKEEVVSACDKIDEIFKLLPDHLIGIGTRMNLFDPDVIRMENESKMHLIYIHQRHNICNNGQRGENLDMGETGKKLKSMKKAIEKQKKKIKKSDTDYENTYNYYYEF
jgi:hypothetical protein